MIFKLIDMSKADLIELLEEDTNRDFKSKTDAKLLREAYDALIPNNPSYPSVYLFTQLGRDHEYADFNNYVLVDSQDSDAQVYKAQSSVVRSVYWGATEVLKEIAQSWQGDTNSILSEVYGIAHIGIPASADENNVSVWVDYDSGKKSHYVLNTEGEPINFDSHAAAQEFIDNCPDAEGEEFVPNYVIVAAPTAKVLVPQVKTLK